MWAIYLIGLRKEIPHQILKADLVHIITVLCNELGWVEVNQGSPQVEISREDNSEIAKEGRADQRCDQENTLYPTDLPHIPSGDNKPQENMDAISNGVECMNSNFYKRLKDFKRKGQLVV